MDKFRDMAYERPELAKIKAQIRVLGEQLKGASDIEGAKAAFQGFLDETRKAGTMETLADIRNTLDMTDEFYEGEMEYFHREDPGLELEKEGFVQILLASPYLEQLREVYGDFYFTRLANVSRLVSEKNVELLVKESSLVQKYAKCSATASTEFEGESLNFYGLLKKMQDTNREMRRRALEAWADLYQSIAPQLDEIYSELVQVRCRMAENLGFSDYVDMAYLKNERYTYGREEVSRFRDAIVKHVVPLCQRLFEEQRQRLGVEVLHYYDEALVFPEGNVYPQGTPEEMLDQAQKMYEEMSLETGEFFSFMRAHELFDLETRPGKQPGGYCTFLDTEKAPFIFSNFNGTSADVDVLTHEAGHAFEAYVASRQDYLVEQSFSSSEINEIHSMTMEFFAYPWMGLFFGEEKEKYIYAHLSDCLQVIPYMACVDEFQQRVYEERLTDAEARYDLWHELEQKYLPWRSYGGHTFLEKGGFWMQKQHIFMYPFYYIDYALAQMGAFEYLIRMEENREEAWKDYYRLCCAGGSQGYFELLKIGNLSNPFQEETVERIVKQLEEKFFA